jgi:hypothetical protein
MAKLTGGGILGNKNVNVGVKTGSPSKGSSPCAAAQIGASTAFKKENVEVGPAYHSGVKLGNEKALDVGKGGPGTGRTVMRSGSQSLHGPVNQGESPRSEPRGLDVRGRLKGEV